MATSKTRFLVISDTHNVQPSLAPSLQAFRKPLPKADVFIHCGDITNLGRFKEFEQTIAFLKHDVDAELKLVIAGNHDRSLDREYWRDHRYSDEPLQEHEDSVKLWKDAEGINYLDEGVHTFQLKSGAKFSVYASPYTPEFCAWAFPYKRIEDRFNPPESVSRPFKSIAENPVPDFPGIDILVTHGPPRNHLDNTTRGVFAGCEHLRKVLRRAKPLMHCFGHIHEGYGAQKISWKSHETDESDEGIIPLPGDFKKAQENRANFVDATSSGVSVVSGQDTLVVNAAIMDVKYKPVNAPCLIDLELSQNV